MNIQKEFVLISGMKKVSLKFRIKDADGVIVSLASATEIKFQTQKFDFVSEVPLEDTLTWDITCTIDDAVNGYVTCLITDVNCDIAEYIGIFQITYSGGVIDKSPANIKIVIQSGLPITS